MPSEDFVRKAPVPCALPYELPYMTDELRKRARTELYEDEETRVHSLKLLRTMLDDEKNLYYMNEDTFLLAFLRARKFDVKKAFNLVKTFYNVKAKHEAIFENYEYDQIDHTLAENSVGFLPYRDEEGSVILIIHAGRWNPYKNSMGDLMRALTSGLIHAIHSPSTQVAGFKVIVDFKDFSMGKMTHISSNYLLLFAEALQDCFPARFRGVHIVNEGYLFTSVWSILKTFLTKKLKDRFHFHGKDVSKLHKYFSPSILPKEYGGELPPFDNSDWAESMSKMSNKFVYMQKYGYKKKNKN